MRWIGRQAVVDLDGCTGVGTGAPCYSLLWLCRVAGSWWRIDVVWIASRRPPSYHHLLPRGVVAASRCDSAIVAAAVTAAASVAACGAICVGRLSMAVQLLSTAATPVAVPPPSSPTHRQTPPTPTQPPPLAILQWTCPPG